MTSVTGTSHFVSLHKAVLYYSLYGIPQEEVERKLREGEIALGVPVVEKGQKILLNSEGRYFIETRN